MSLISVSSESADRLIDSANSCCSEVSLVASRKSVIPSTPFMGVRISWLMFARNRLLSCVASRAVTSADSSSSFFRSSS